MPELSSAEAAEEAAFLQQAATKWTRTAFWAAQDSAHAVMLKAQAESLSGMSLADEDVSNSALLHLELKVARKKLVRLSSVLGSLSDTVWQAMQGLEIFDAHCQLEITTVAPITCS